MTSVSRTSQVTNTAISGSAGPEWDSRLNRLLEDLQESVIPSDNTARSNASEFREFRMTSSRKTNDEPETRVDEKWVEYGSNNGMGGIGETSSSSRKFHESSSSSSRMDKSVNFQEFGGAKDQMQVQYLTPANQTTVVSSLSPGPSPTFDHSHSPKVEKKEFYSKQSFTQLIKGGEPIPTDFPPPGFGGGSETETRRERRFEEFTSGQPMPLPPCSSSYHRSDDHSAHQQSSHHSSMEQKRSMFEKRSTLSSAEPSPAPLYSTPFKSSMTRDFSQRESLTSIPPRSASPPPSKQVEGLKTPPLVRKILQQSSDRSTSAYSSKSTAVEKQTSSLPYDETRDTRYYTATASTKHTQREMSPVRRAGPPPEAPKHLEELMASFGESYDSRRYGGDREHQPIRYGPGSQKEVRIDEHVRERRIREDESSYTNPAYASEPIKSQAGPPVYYPPGQVFKGEDVPMRDVPDTKKQKYKPKSDKDKEGGGAVPVPVCLPVCCAAPCSIM